MFWIMLVMEKGTIKKKNVECKKMVLNPSENFYFGKFIVAHVGTFGLGFINIKTKRKMALPILATSSNKLKIFKL